MQDVMRSSIVMSALENLRAQDASVEEKMVIVRNWIEVMRMEHLELEGIALTAQVNKSRIQQMKMNRYPEV